MMKKISSRLLVVAAGVTLALSASVMGASPVSAAQAGAIANPACGTNTTIFIKTTTTGATTHYLTPTSGSDSPWSWNKGTFSTPTESKTGTGHSTAITVSGTGTTLTSITYSCG